MAGVELDEGGAVGRGGERGGVSNTFVTELKSLATQRISRAVGDVDPGGQVGVQRPRRIFEEWASGNPVGQSAA